MKFNGRRGIILASRVGQTKRPISSCFNVMFGWLSHYVDFDDLHYAYRTNAGSFHF